MGFIEEVPERKDESNYNFILVIYTVVSIAIVFIIVNVITFKVVDAWAIKLISIIFYFKEVSAVAFIMTFGFIAYSIRQRFRLFYACAEMVFGIVYAMYGLAQIYVQSGMSSIGAYTTTIGALYVLIRGIDNFGQALRGRNAEHFWLKVFGKI